jgi:hypothetical protein
MRHTSRHRCALSRRLLVPPRSRFGRKALRSPVRAAHSRRERRSVHKIAVGPGGRPAPEVSGAEGGGHRARRRRRSFAPRCCALSRRRPPRVPRPSAAPGRLPGSPQPPHELRQSLRLVPRDGSARPLPMVGLRLALLRVHCVALGPVRKAGRSQCPRARPRLRGRGAARWHPPTRTRRPPPRTPPVPLRSMGCASPSPTAAACGAPVPAPGTPRPCGRCASRCSLRPRLAPFAALRKVKRGHVLLFTLTDCLGRIPASTSISGSRAVITSRRAARRAGAGA